MGDIICKALRTISSREETVNSGYHSHFHPINGIKYIEPEEKMSILTSPRTMSLWDSSASSWPVWLCSRLLSFTLVTYLGFCCWWQKHCRAPWCLENMSSRVCSKGMGRWKQLPVQVEVPGSGLCYGDCSLSAFHIREKCFHSWKWFQVEVFPLLNKTDKLRITQGRLLAASLKT